MKIIKWNLVEKQDKKDFKDWLLKNDLFISKNFWTNVFNINRNEDFSRKTIEFLAYNKIVLNDKYKSPVIYEEIFNEVKGTNLEEIYKNIVISSEGDQKEYIDYLFILLKNVIEYKKKNIYSLETEYSLTKDHSNFVNSLIKSKKHNFNKLIICINKNIYTKNNGFLSK